jgi:cytochrome c-type biogenesis protein
LGVVLGLAARNGSLTGGVVLLFAYSLGLAVPFVLVGLAFGRLTTMLSQAKQWLWIIELVAGVVLVAFGLLLLTDNVSWISTHLSNLLNAIGLGRLSKS